MTHRFVVLLALLAIGCGTSQTVTPVASPSGSARPTTPASPGRTSVATNSPSGAASSPTAVPTPADGASAAPTPTPASSPTTAPVPTSAPATATPAAPGTPSPVGFSLAVEPFATGFDALTFVANAGDGSGVLYIVEQRGVIWAVSADGTRLDGPFLDISDRTAGVGEQGLLGLAFHPDYESNGRLFVNYTNLPGDTVVAEFARGDADTERVLLTIDQPYPNHNGGMIAFGPDGYLYIGMGDGGSGGDPRNNGQRMNTMLGKMLRIDVNSGDPYGVPDDNPFVGQEATEPEIWSAGWRNPWRFSFDRETGAMFIADVGQGAEEEIDAEPPGEGGRNYGWNVMEGFACFAVTPCDATALGLTLPVASYVQEQFECAAIGGYVYRGSTYPEFVGQYVFTDLCTGILMVLDADAALRDGAAPVLEVGAMDGNPTTFGEDEAGELYVATGGGDVFRVIAQP